MKLKDFKNILILTIILFPIYSRGLFQYTLNSKTIAYILQVVAILIFILYILISSTINIKKLNKFYIISSFSFFIIVVISSILTYLRFKEIDEIILFSGAMLFLFFIFIIMNLHQFKEECLTQFIVKSIFMIGSILFIYSIIEQSGILFKSFHVALPGFSAHYGEGFFITRPASLTGSMLHYPIIMPLIGVITLRYLKNIFCKIMGSFFLLAPFIVFSRSGILITSITVLPYFTYIIIQLITSIFKGEKINIQKIRFYIIVSIPIIAAGIIIILLSKPIYNYIILIIDRILAFNDTSNSSRFHIFNSTITTFLRSNLFFGEFTGMATNIVRNILGHSHLIEKTVFATGVTESGFLEILTSYGIFGVLCYYGTLLYTSFKLFYYQNEKLLSFALIGVIAQTFFYQSTEVLPFVFTFSLIPLLANNTPKENTYAEIVQQ